MKRLVFIIVATLVFLISVMLLLSLAGDFEVKDVTANEETTVGNKISFSKYHSAKMSFANFDVNEDGSLLLVSESDILDPAIYVYDSEGNFQYKYTVETDGALYAEWQGRDIWIYIFRGDRAVLVDDSGNLVEVTQIAVPASNTEYWDAVCAKEKTVGDKTYAATTEVDSLESFLNEYDCVSVTDQSGEKILYNATLSLWGKVIFMVLSAFVILFVGGSAVVLTVKRIARRRSENRESCAA